MKKPSTYTLLMWLASLIVVVGAILQIMHQISMGTMLIFFALSFLLTLIARKFRPKAS